VAEPLSRAAARRLLKTAGQAQTVPAALSLRGDAGSQTPALPPFRPAADGIPPRTSGRHGGTKARGNVPHRDSQRAGEGDARRTLIVNA